MKSLSIFNLRGLEPIREIQDINVDGLLNFESFMAGANRLILKRNLKIRGHSKLKDLTSLEFLPKIGGVVINLSNLPSLKGLEIVEDVEHLQLESPTVLESLIGLEGLKTAKYFALEESLVQDISSLGQLEIVHGDFSLYKNSRVFSLAGLQRLKIVEGDLRLEGLMIKDLTNLPTGLAVEGNLYLNFNENLESLHGFDRLEKVGKDLQIKGHPQLQNLEGMDDLEKIDGDLILSDNSKLKSLEGLRNLSEIGGDLGIEGHPHLQSLAGLEGIKIGGHAFIGYAGNFFGASEASLPELSRNKSAILRQS